MIQTQVIAPAGQVMDAGEVAQALHRSLEGRFSGKRVLVLIPDHTRSLPLPFLFQNLVEALHDAGQLDFMVALGTHPPLSLDSICRLVGISIQEKEEKYGRIGLYNHDWSDPSALISIGSFEKDRIRQIAGNCWHPSLPEKIDITINKAICEYDHILVVGPTFPHEVVGFSGGAKYLFPGIAGPEMINAMHWLGALATVVGTIGKKDTPVRAMIHAAFEKVKTPVTMISLVVEGHDISGLVIGDVISAWNVAADLSSLRHIRWCEKPYRLVLSRAPEMYDELWTAAKAMYKLEPAVAVGGEVIIYAPHLDVVSHVHGKYIDEIGYHILPYFLENWENYQHIPLGVLAHSTHVRGSGKMENGVEKPNVKVTLASKISPQDCKKLNLGYLDPQKVNVCTFQNREDKDILYVPRAGEMLYKLKEPGSGV